MTARPRLTLTLLAAAALATTRSADDCATGTHCYLPRWVPDDSAIFESYGSAVAIDGDTAAVGALGGAPVAIYERTANTWVQTQSLPNPSGVDGQLYGGTLALDGDFLVVGSRGDYTFGPSSGAVHVFERSDGVWSLFETIHAPVPAPDENFGNRVDLDGSWLAVATSPEFGDAALHVYLRTFTGWEHVTEFTFPSGFTELPIAVQALAEDLSARFLIGHPTADGQGPNAGGATLYTLTPTDLHEQSVPQPVLDAGDLFGREVSLGGSTLAITARMDDDAAVGAGAVYVYEVGPELEFPSLTLVDKLVPCGSVPHTAFGASLKVDETGLRLAVGAPGYETETEAGGAVYVCGPGPFGGWTTYDTIVAAEGEEDDLLGTGVDLQGQALLVGARNATVTDLGSGTAYFVSLASSELAGGECPCESLAEIGTYGSGKPGSAGTPELTLGHELVPGESSLLKLDDVLVGGQPVLAWGLVPAEIPFDEGAFLIADPHFLALPTVGVLGQVGSQLNVPEESFLCGVTVYFQALLIDPGATGVFSTAQSNGVQATIGY